MKARKSFLPSQNSFKAWFTKRKIILLLAVASAFAASASIYAATSSATGTISIKTYEVVEGGFANLGNVDIHVDSYGSLRECSDNKKTTFPASSSQHGQVNFTGCPIKTLTGKSLRYLIKSAQRNGYELTSNNSVKVKTSRFSIKSKPRMAKLNLYFKKVGSPVSPAAGTIGTVKNKGNIVSVTQTHHAYDYPLAQPDDGWISNYTNAYYLGSIYVGWSIDLVKLKFPDPNSQYGTESSNGYMFGLISRSDGTVVGCGWVEPGTVNKSTLQAHTNICSNHPFLNSLQTNEDINNIRKLFGQQFNCNKGDTYSDGGEDKCNSPITLDAIDMNPNCGDHTLYRNYFSNNNYSEGSFSNPVGKIDLTKNDALRYRFTTRDGKAAVVAGAATYGWGFIDRTCINGTPTNKYYWEVRHPDRKRY